jgi:hypothetical protein
MKYQVGEKVFAYMYDSFGYYCGNDFGDGENVEILDSVIKGDTEVYLTKTENHKWREYSERELFKNKEEFKKFLLDKG